MGRRAFAEISVIRGDARTNHRIRVRMALSLSLKGASLQARIPGAQFVELDSKNHILLEKTVRNHVSNVFDKAGRWDARSGDRVRA